VATTLNNLATLYKATGRFGQAEQAFAEAVSIRRDLVKGNSRVYGPSLAETLRSLGSLYERMGRRSQVEACFVEAARLDPK
jgi:tetratricopeptide (TPR) repeat protein